MVFIVFKVPAHLIPRRWSNKSSKGAIRVDCNRQRYSGSIVDPFADWSNSYFKHKAREGKALRDKRNASNKWKQRHLSLYFQHTEVSGIQPVIL